MSNPSGYLPHLLGPVNFQVGGVESGVERRETINLIGATVADDEANERTNITFPSFTAPTGTGMVSVTSGALDAASRAVAAGWYTFAAAPSGANLASLLTSALPASKGGTGLSAYGTALYVLRMNAAGTALEYVAPTGTGSAVFSSAPVLEQAKLIEPWVLDAAALKYYKFVGGGAGLADHRTCTLPVLTGPDTVVFAAHAETLTNKTFNVADNSLTSTSGALGDLLYHNGTKFVRLPRGTANQVLTTNAGATDIGWAAAGGTPPTGTGFGHVTAGAWDAASVKVDLTNAADVTVPAVANGVVTSSGTGGVLQQAENVLAGSGYISIGASPSSGGLVRTPYDASSARIILGGVASDASQRAIIKSGGDIITFGDTTGSTVVDGSSVELKVGGAAVMTLGAGHFSMGSTPATAGIMRLPYVAADTIVGIKDSSGTNRALVSRTSANINQFGNASQATDIHATALTLYAASGALYLYGAGTSSLYLTGSQNQNLVPITGNPSGTSPYGVHGGVVVTPAADGNVTLAGTAYGYDWLQIDTGAWLTGPYGVIFPTPATKAKGFYKTVFNNSGQTITVQNGGVATRTLATGLAQRFWFDDGGAFFAGATFTP